MTFDLGACRAMLELTAAQVRARLEINGAGEIHEGVKYEGLAGVTQYYNRDVLPARIYVRADRVDMVYVPSGPALAGVTCYDLDAEAGGKPVSFRSRAGKEYVHYAHTEQGLAYSAKGDDVRFVEVFPPCSLDAYEREIYRDPGPFIR
jgi:hypothetical protein